jgi:hypothetical protein
MALESKQSVKILGHTTKKMTAQYAVVTDHKIGQDMARLSETLQNHSALRRSNDYTGKVPEHFWHLPFCI